MVPVEYWVSFLRTKTKNRSKNLATTTTIWMEVKGRRFTAYHYQTSQRYRDAVVAYYQDKSNVILEVIQEVHTPKIISTETH